MCWDKNDWLWQKTIAKEAWRFAKKDCWGLEFRLEASIWHKVAAGVERLLKGNRRSRKEQDLKVQFLGNWRFKIWMIREFRSERRLNWGKKSYLEGWIKQKKAVLGGRFSSKENHYIPIMLWVKIPNNNILFLLISLSLIQLIKHSFILLCHPCSTLYFFLIITCPNLQIKLFAYSQTMPKYKVTLDTKDKRTEECECSSFEDLNNWIDKVFNIEIKNIKFKKPRIKVLLP